MNRELWVEKHSFNKEDLLQFAWMSGDHNPIHYSQNAVNQRGFDKLIVHGMCLYFWVYSLFMKKFPQLSMSTFDAKFSSITWVDEEIRAEADAKSENEIKVSIYACASNELKCVFYINYLKAA